jgi:hypothetical protein
MSTELNRLASKWEAAASGATLHSSRAAAIWGACASWCLPAEPVRNGAGALPPNLGYNPTNTSKTISEVARPAGSVGVLRGEAAISWN